MAVVETRKSVAGRLVNAANAFLSSARRVRRVFVSPVPVSVPGGYVAMLNSPLLNYSGESVGEVRVSVFSPEDLNLAVRVRVEWTRHAFGFWYRDEFYLNEGQIVDFVKRLKNSLYFVKITADGTVNVASMNRGGFSKIRKSKTMDSAARVGLVIG